MVGELEEWWGSWRNGGGVGGMVGELEEWWGSWGLFFSRKGSESFIGKERSVNLMAVFDFAKK